MTTKHNLFSVKSFTGTESGAGKPFISLGPEDSSDDKGNFATVRLYFEPDDALAVGKALVLHAHRCGATDPETKETDHEAPTE